MTRPGFQQDKSKMSAKIESLTKECSALKQKIDDMSKGGEKTKQDLHQKNSSLLSQVSQLEIKIKDMENSSLVSYYN